MTLDLTGLDEVSAPSTEELSTVAKLAQMQLDAERQVAAAQEALEYAQSNLKRIREKSLPDAMAQIGMEKFTLTDGTEIDIKEAIYANISEKNRLQAHNWLRHNEHGAIIKNTVTASFNAGNDEMADKVREYLNKLGVDFDSKSSVHAGTLRAWVKDQLAEGNPVPESITHYEQRISRVKVKTG